MKFSINLELSRVMLYNVDSRKTVGKFSVYALACQMYVFDAIAYNVSREQFFWGTCSRFFYLKKFCRDFVCQKIKHFLILYDSFCEQTLS